MKVLSNVPASDTELALDSPFTFEVDEIIFTIPPLSFTNYIYLESHIHRTVYGVLFGTFQEGVSVTESNLINRDLITQAKDICEILAYLVKKPSMDFLKKIGYIEYKRTWWNIITNEPIPTEGQYDWRFCLTIYFKNAIPLATIIHLLSQFILYCVEIKKKLLSLLNNETGKPSNGRGTSLVTSSQGSTLDAFRIG